MFAKTVVMVEKTILPFATAYLVESPATAVMNIIYTQWWAVKGAPKRPDTFESLIKIKPVDENRKCSHFWKAYSMPFCVEYAKHEHYIL